ncbi:MAG: hypothetical protein WC838_04245 [Candidatus Margulisiibacteriota bacterium]|jgi:hypothetical protein
MGQISAEQIAVYRQLGPEQRMKIGMELYDTSRELLRAGIIGQYPEYTPDQVRLEELKRLEFWYNKNY